MAELPSNESISASLSAVEEALRVLELQVLELTYVGNRKDVDPEALACILARSKEIKASFTIMETEAAKALSTIVSDGSVIEADGKQVERKDSKPRKTWKHDQLKSVVIEKVLERHRDPEDGTISTPTSVMIQEVLGYAGISYWKVGPLKEIGINPDNYCSKGEVKPKFSVVQSSPTESKDEDDDFLD